MIEAGGSSGDPHVVAARARDEGAGECFSSVKYVDGEKRLPGAAVLHAEAEGAVMGGVGKTTDFDAGDSNRIIDEYGYARTKADLSGEKLGKGIQSITRQRNWWKAEFPDGIIDPDLAQKWRRRATSKEAATDDDAASSARPLRASTSSGGSGGSGGSGSSSPRSPPEEAAASPRGLAQPPQPQLKRRPSFVQALGRLNHRDAAASAEGDALTMAIRLGVPPEIRERVWLSCTGGLAKKAAAAAEDCYEAVLRRAEQNNPFAAQIERDLRRTLPTNTHFQKEEGIDALR